MKSKRITVELILYLLAFLLAIGIRFLHLGAGSLSNSEAVSALQAWEVSTGESSGIGPEPGYILLTGLVFFLGGASEALARFWPALAGSLIVWLPWILRSLLERSGAGWKAGVILAFGLALDPGLVSASRLAGGPMMAAAFGLLALAFVFTGRYALAGACAGLAMLGGPHFLHGTIGLLLAWSAGKFILGAAPLNWSTPASQPEKRAFSILAGGVTLAFVGTLFFRFPQGLGAVAAQIPAYLEGWVISSGVPAGRLLAALVFYQPLALLFAIVSAIRSWRMKTGDFGRLMSLWAAIALLLALVYAGRQTLDLVWVLIPLWVLAAIEMARYLNFHSVDRLPDFAQAALIVLLLSLTWINLAGLNYGTAEIQIYRLRWAVIGGTILLGVITTILIGLGWSWAVAQRGLVWGLMIALGFYMLGSGWGAWQLRRNSPQELWIPPPTTLQADLLERTLEDLSEWRTGQQKALDLVVTSDSPALRWTLRDWKQAVFKPVIGPDELPSVIISAEQETSPSLAAAYRGQDFSWRAYPGWGGALPVDWPAWLVFRKGPLAQERIVLWARGDLFPQDDQVTTSAPEPDQADVLDQVPGPGE